MHRCYHMSLSEKIKDAIQVTLSGEIRELKEKKYKWNATLDKYITLI